MHLLFGTFKLKNTKFNYTTVIIISTTRVHTSIKAKHFIVDWMNLRIDDCHGRLLSIIFPYHRLSFLKMRSSMSNAWDHGYKFVEWSSYFLPACSDKFLFVPYDFIRGDELCYLVITRWSPSTNKSINVNVLSLFYAFILFK